MRTDPVGDVRIPRTGKTGDSFDKRFERVLDDVDTRRDAQTDNGPKNAARRETGQDAKHVPDQASAHSEAENQTNETNDAAPADHTAAPADPPTRRDTLVQKLSQLRTATGKPVFTDPDQIEALADVLMGALEHTGPAGQFSEILAQLQQIATALLNGNAADGSAELARAVPGSTSGAMDARIAAFLGGLVKNAGDGNGTNGAHGRFVAQLQQLGAARSETKMTDVGMLERQANAAAQTDAGLPDTIVPKPEQGTAKNGNQDVLTRLMAAGAKGAGSAVAGAGPAGQTSAAAIQTSDLSAMAPQSTDSPNLAANAQNLLNGTAQQTVRQVQSPVPAAAVANSVAIDIAKFAQRGETRFEIRLDPPELGRVDVRLRIGNDGMIRAHLFVEQSETLDMFMRDSRSLERALDQQGLKTAQGGLEFSLGTGGRNGGFQEQMAGSDEAFSDDMGGDEEPAAQAVTTYRVTLARDGRVDIQV